MNENLVATLILLLYFSPLVYQLVLVLKERKRGNIIPFKRLVKTAKYTFLFLFILIAFFATINHTNYLDYEKPMTYDKYEEITFENFRGLEFFRKSLYGNKHFAYVVTTIESNIEDDSVEVKSFFHPSQSYVYNNKTNSLELLQHEKYHIKITELFARKAKQKVAQLNHFDKDKISEVIRATKEEERAFQREYDYNTFHSYVLSEQKRYERQVDSLLTLLSEYKNPKIKINDQV
ncbi:hypothetical protein JJL45_02785 [Tamlana sp. s12]|uniref:hypothetical protein n=1 Tax=Tamlana sp. s12 TaxID=1630406 RepID=UPI0007FF5871|nr:hypothetical protein [Tamlana sp. s12]OBQ51993.1 hypothetical protein VQ01_14775 [Tamlana sp. s12]QQY82935.1 hypothetical protein JJL45_02785 [Tamlana sp. s12]